MNKKQAIAYAQVALDFMQSSKYKEEINPKNLGIEMKQAFKIYNNKLIEDIANSQIYADDKLKSIKKK